MSDKSKEQPEENFAEMLEQSFSDMKELEPGQLVKAEIVSISNEYIFLQISGKSEGILDKEELTDKEGQLSVQEGDSIEAYYLYSKNGEMNFTTRISSEKAGNALLQQAFEKGIPVEGTVEKEIKGGFEVKLGDTRAFCPFSQMGQRRVENASEWVGQHLSFKITEYNEKGRNILVSNRAILEEEKDKVIESLRKTLKVNDKITCKVVSLQKFGAFVDLGGVQALLPISEVSRTRVEDISQVLSEGQEIEAVVLNLDWQNERLSVSMKALQADPWDKARSAYKPGTRHTGKVVRMTNFGAFVQLEPGLDGLVHISELEGDSRDGTKRDMVKKGQSLTVQIHSIDSEKKRISLKPISSTEEDEAFQKYMKPDSDSEGDAFNTETYNPFAALLKDRVAKEKEK